MGGRAFLQTMNEAQFPRMNNQTYLELKSFCESRLRSLFSLVAVPPEDPEKSTHGDIDFIVAGPLKECTHLPVSEISAALGAEHTIPLEGENISNFALPSEIKDVYRQVDVRVCAPQDFDRLMFFYSYGALGAILGKMVTPLGLTFNPNGLRISLRSAVEELGNRRFHLSSDIDAILEFFRLDYAGWKVGFPNRISMFRWIQQSQFYFPQHLIRSTRSIRALEEQQTYKAFIEFLQSTAGIDANPAAEPAASVVNRACIAFHKDQEYKSIVNAHSRSQKLKSILNGKVVMEWTGLYGTIIREIIQRVKERVSEDEMVAMSFEEMEEVVKKIQAEMDESGLQA